MESRPDLLDRMTNVEDPRLQESDLNPYSDPTLKFEFSDVSSLDESESEVQDIGTQCPVSNGKRRKKKHFCPFCKMWWTKFAIHLKGKHCDVDEVKQFLQMEKKSRERRRIIDKIRGKGAIEFNKKHATGDEILVARRGKINSKDRYLPCLNCNNYYLKGNIRGHYKICAKNEGPPNLMSKCKSLNLITRAGKVEMSPELIDVIVGMSARDTIMKSIQTDPNIIRFGNRLCVKYAPLLGTQKQNIRRSLIVISSILVHMYENDDDKDKKLSVSYYYCQRKFELFKKAVFAKIGFENGEYRAPSMAAAFGRAWIDCSKVLSDLYIDEGNSRAKRELDLWLEKYNSDFHETVEKPAELYLHERRKEKKMEIPSDEDVCAFYQFLVNNIEREKTVLNNEFCEYAWTKLSKALVVFTTVFNKKKSGGVQCTLLKNFFERDKFDGASGNWNNHSSKQDAEQTNKYCRFFTTEKNSKGVSVILERKYEEAVELIVKYRKEAGVSQCNEFLFGLGSDGHFNCRSCMREFRMLCDAKDPSLLTTNKLRKHFSSLLPMLDLPENEMLLVSRFMGLNLGSILSQRRLPSKIGDMTRLAPILQAASIGSLPRLKASSARTVDDCPSSIPPASDSEDDNLWETSSSDSDDGFSSDGRRTPKKHSQVTETSPKGNNQICKKVDNRKRWTPMQRKVIEKAFGSYLDQGAIPPGSLIEKCLKKNKAILQQRTVAQIRSYMSNINTGKRYR